MIILRPKRLNFLPVSSLPQPPRTIFFASDTFIHMKVTESQNIRHLYAARPVDRFTAHHHCLTLRKEPGNILCSLPKRALPNSQKLTIPSLPRPEYRRPKSKRSCRVAGNIGKMPTPAYMYHLWPKPRCSPSVPSPKVLKVEVQWTPASELSFRLMSSLLSIICRFDVETPSKQNMSTRNLVVTGATGKQGGALIAALLAMPSHPFEIYAVTRDRNSKSAQALARNARVHLVEGEFENPVAILAQVPKPWGLFSVTMPLKGAAWEERTGKAMTRAALDAGVQHIVFTSTDRGGQQESETQATPIPHFVSKFNVEKDIVSTAPAKGATWTFLRPVAFMENLSNDFLGKAFMTMWKLNGLERKLQLINTKDIGKVAADAFLNAGEQEYRNRAISLAGDEIRPAEAAQIFRETFGKEIPTTFGFVGSGLKWMLKDLLGLMFDWFKASGFKTDVQAVRQRYPFMQDFRTWLVEESAWKEQK
nr:hypothetical protein CFP56_59651 [Quercus suber]